MDRRKFLLGLAAAPAALLPGKAEAAIPSVEEWCATMADAQSYVVALEEVRWHEVEVKSGIDFAGDGRYVVTIEGVLNPRPAP